MEIFYTKCHLDSRVIRYIFDNLGPGRVLRYNLVDVSRYGKQSPNYAQSLIEELRNISDRNQSSAGVVLADFSDDDGDVFLNLAQSAPIRLGDSLSIFVANPDFVPEMILRTFERTSIPTYGAAQFWLDPEDSAHEWFIDQVRDKTTSFFGRFPWSVHTKNPTIAAKSHDAIVVAIETISSLGASPNLWAEWRSSGQAPAVAGIAGDLYLVDGHIFAGPISIIHSTDAGDYARDVLDLRRAFAE